MDCEDWYVNTMNIMQLQESMNMQFAGTCSELEDIVREVSQEKKRQY